MESTAIAARPPAQNPPSENRRDASRMMFISYAREDKDFALKLAADLDAQGVNVWIDKKEIQVGNDWSQTIEEALRQSTELVVILSPDSTAPESEVRNEVQFAKNLGLPIRPVLYRPCETLLVIAKVHHIEFTDWTEEGFKELVHELTKRLPWPRTSLRRVRIFLKKFYRPLLAGLALVSGITAAIYFLSPSNTSFIVSGGDKSAITVNVHNGGGRPSMLIGSSFKLSFGSLPIETEPLILLQPEKHSRIAGHGDESIRLTADNMLTPKLKSEDSYFSREDIAPLLPGAKLILTAQVRESDGRLLMRSEVFPVERIQSFVLEESPYDVP